MATSEVFTIDDLLQGELREVRIVSGEFVLIPHYIGGNSGFSDKITYLGVAEGFGKFEGPGQFQGNPFVKLCPFYRIEMPEDENIANVRVEEWVTRSQLLPNFFKSIHTGPAEAIALALRVAPFLGMEQLAYAIERLEIPYNPSLRDFIEKRVRAMVKIA